MYGASSIFGTRDKSYKPRPAKSEKVSCETVRAATRVPIFDSNFIYMNDFNEAQFKT